MQFKCKTCGIEREEQYFSKTKNKGKTVDVLPYHTWLGKCKICQGVKELRGKYIKLDIKNDFESKLKRVNKLSKESIKFLNDINKKNHIDYIDSFKMLLYFDETFGYISTELDDMEVKDQLDFMYNKLMLVYKNNNN
jgi:hypothetical protein